EDRGVRRTRCLDTEADDWLAILGDVQRPALERRLLRKNEREDLVREARVRGLPKGRSRGARAEAERRREQGGERRPDRREEELGLHAVAPRRSSRTATRSPNMLCGSSMPRLRNLSRKTGRRPVGRRPPM